MITEKLIRDAYVFLREKNNTIPSEVLDFMLRASIDMLKQTEEKKISPEAQACVEISQQTLANILMNDKIFAAHMAGQRNAGIDPSRKAAKDYCKQLQNQQ